MSGRLRSARINLRQAAGLCFVAAWAEAADRLLAGEVPLPWPAPKGAGRAGPCPTACLAQAGAAVLADLVKSISGAVWLPKSLQKPLSQLPTTSMMCAQGYLFLDSKPIFWRQGSPATSQEYAEHIL